MRCPGLELIRISEHHITESYYSVSLHFCILRLLQHGEVKSQVLSAYCRTAGISFKNLTIWNLINIEFWTGNVNVSSCLRTSTCISYQLISSQYLCWAFASVNEQPIRKWLRCIQTSFGIINLLEDNSIESISLHWLQSNQSIQREVCCHKCGFSMWYYVWEHVLNQIYLPDKHVFSHSECSSSLQSFIIIGVLIDYDMWEQRHETA